jgi:hypothetical protein
MSSSFFETPYFAIRFDKKKYVADNVRIDSTTITFLSRHFLVNLA